MKMYSPGLETRGQQKRSQMPENDSIEEEMKLPAAGGVRPLSRAYSQHSAQKKPSPGGLGNWKHETQTNSHSQK